MSRNTGPRRRLQVTAAVVDKALAAFERAAASLEEAADEAADVVTEVEVKVADLTLVRDEAYRQQASYAARANKIREFLK